MSLSNIEDQRWMNHALALAKKAQALGEVPVGAVLVLNNQLVGEGWNQPIQSSDPTAHAEVNCIRQAALALKTLALNGCTLYSTTEPCPMCLSAIHWAKIDRVVFGATIADAAAAGFCELFVDAKFLAEIGKSPLKVASGLLRDECAALFAEWKTAGLCKAY